MYSKDVIAFEKKNVEHWWRSHIFKRSIIKDYRTLRTFSFHFSNENIFRWCILVSRYNITQTML